MKIAYIAHPIKDAVKSNLRKIYGIIREINVHEPDTVPFVPYIGDLIAMNDGILTERQRGMANNMAILNSGMIDEIRLYGDRISDGMKMELNVAFKKNIRIRPMTPGTTKDFDDILSYLGS